MIFAGTLKSGRYLIMPVWPCLCCNVYLLMKRETSEQSMLKSTRGWNDENFISIQGHRTNCRKIYSRHIDSAKRTPEAGNRDQFVGQLILVL